MEADMEAIMGTETGEKTTKGRRGERISTGHLEEGIHPSEADSVEARDRIRGLASKQLVVKSRGWRDLI
jgi:hypothetical protein